MGMDVFGREPRSARGKYFRANVMETLRSPELTLRWRHNHCRKVHDVDPMLFDTWLTNWRLDSLPLSVLCEWCNVEIGNSPGMITWLADDELE
jgi:hypothetical protein